MNAEVKQTASKSGDGMIKPFAEDANFEFSLDEWREDEIEVLKEVEIGVMIMLDRENKRPFVMLSAVPDSSGFGPYYEGNVGNLIAEAMTACDDPDQMITALEDLRVRIDEVIAGLKQQEEEATTSP